jgi:hypothetical protein
LAFILMNLPGITQLDHPDRSPVPQATADLLWFPTGGGKTEAYLGLTAYTLALRRLQGVIEGRSGEYGVAVLMRYTLRLLTIQQFQRATALICACEFLRREAVKTGSAQWGREPFRLGLWVGKKVTPNTTAQCEEAIKQGRGLRGPEGGIGTPLQLTYCPWCGSAIEAGRHIRVENVKQGRGRTFTYCGDPLGQCPFSMRNAPDEGLPLMAVDEEIYRRLPALLIATVDKFAQLPWFGQTQMLFGQVDGVCDRHGFRSSEIEDADRHPARGGLPPARSRECNPIRPPDLIIQDELHLISGPLGSLVGLYETAIDKICTWQVNGRTVRPKVVASTATSRKSSADIPRILDLLEVPFDPSLPAGTQGKRPLSVLLATNMVSVGVDVRRLGLMVVGGQPKTTAEYIQATSRVGRSFPGLICTVFNWARPRDLSHYETFEQYHATFYKHVEALSAAPFAARALDRGLSALLVALVRLRGKDFNGNNGAGRIQRTHSLVGEAIAHISDRAGLVTGKTDAAEFVRASLQARLDNWLATAQGMRGGAELGYKRRSDTKTVGLLATAGEGDWKTFTCLTSLRDVEPGVGLILDERGMDEDPSFVPAVNTADENAEEEQA